MQPRDFIATARDLAGTNRRRPRQTNLRRAVSTAYYALFHCLTACCADTLAGRAGAGSSAEAWRQAYRALNHGPAGSRCKEAVAERNFPPGILDFAMLFTAMKRERERADYDPDARFTKAEVTQHINETATTISGFLATSIKDRRAFAVYVLLRTRQQS